MNPAECKHTWGQWHEEASGHFRKCGWCGFVAVDNLTDAADAENDALREKVMASRDALTKILRLASQVPIPTNCQIIQLTCLETLKALDRLS